MKPYLCLNGVAPNLDHSVTASTDLKGAVAEHVAPVARLVHPIADRGRHVVRPGNEPLGIKFRAVQVAPRKGRSTDVNLPSQK